MNLIPREAAGVDIGLLLIRTGRVVRGRFLAVLLLLLVLMLPHAMSALAPEIFGRSLFAIRGDPWALAWASAITLLRILVFSAAVAVSSWACGVWKPDLPGGLRAIAPVGVVVLVESIPSLLLQAAAALRPDLISGYSMSELAELTLVAGFFTTTLTLLAKSFVLMAGPMALAERRSALSSLERSAELSARSRWTVAGLLTATQLAKGLIGGAFLFLMYRHYVAPSPLLRYGPALAQNAITLLAWLASAPLYLDRREAHEGLEDDTVKTFD